MKTRLALALFAGATLVSAASAQVLVLGSSLGKECYDAVVNHPQPEAVHERACTIALNSGTLDSRNRAATLINRGIILMRMNKFDRSLEDYERAKDIRPNLGAIYLNEGAALIGIGDHAGAIASLERALELDTQDAHAAHYNLGLAHELSGDAASAYHSYRKALDIRPGWDLPEQELVRFTVVKGES